MLCWYTLLNVPVSHVRRQSTLQLWQILLLEVLNAYANVFNDSGVHKSAYEMFLEMGTGEFADNKYIVEHSCKWQQMMMPSINCCSVKNLSDTLWHRLRCSKMCFWPPQYAKQMCFASCFHCKHSQYSTLSVNGMRHETTDVMTRS